MEEYEEKKRRQKNVQQIFKKLRLRKSKKKGR